MYRRTLFTLFTLLAVALMATTPACMAGTLTEEEAYSRTLAVSSQKTLEVHNINGHIYVTGWDRDEISVEALKRASDPATLKQIRIHIEETADRYRIEVKLPRRRGFFQWSPAASVSFDLKVPRSMVLDLESTNGALKVAQMDAPARLDTTNGTIEIDQVTGDIEADTTNGSIQLGSINGKVDVTTTNGKVTLENITGCARARSTNGAIEAQIQAQPTCEHLYFRTTNGSIYLQINPTALRRIEAHASNGRIRVRLPARTVEVEKRRRVELDLGTSGAVLEMSTTNGSITVEQFS